MGAERRVRVLRRADGAAQFWLEGEKLATLDVSGDVRGLYAQVVGATASFSYGPGAVTTPSSLSAVDTGLRLDRPAHTCEQLGASCVPRR